MSQKPTVIFRNGKLLWLKYVIAQHLNKSVKSTYAVVNSIDTNT